MTAGAIDDLRRAVDWSEVPDELVARFDADGFARLPALLDPEALHPFAPVVTEVARSSAQAAVTVDAASMRSMSKNTPFNGWKLRGGVAATIVGGRTVFVNPGLQGLGI